MDAEREQLTLFFKTTERDKLFYGKLDILTANDALNFSMIKYT